jgi:hydrogenase expression/formation protein HypC
MCLAVPGRIVSIEGDLDSILRCAKVDFAGVRKEVNLAFTPEANVGDYVLVHVGFALNTVDEEEARRIWETLQELSDAAEEMESPPE